MTALEEEEERELEATGPCSLSSLSEEEYSDTGEGGSYSFGADAVTPLLLLAAIAP